MATNIDSIKRESVLAEVGLWGHCSWLLRKLLFSRASQMFIDGGTVAAALFLSYLIRFDGRLPAPYHDQLLLVTPFTIMLYVSVNLLWGVYKLVWHFIGYRDSGTLAGSVASAASLFFLINLAYADASGYYRTPLGVNVLHPILTYGGWIAVRVLRRVTYGRVWSRKNGTEGNPSRKRLLLVGAGQAGLYLLRELNQNTDFDIVGFLDDSPELRGRTIEGRPVLGTTTELESIVKAHRIDEVTLCMPSAPGSAVLRVASRCRQIAVGISTVPTLSEIVLGKVNISRLRAVGMEELLGRESVNYEPDDQLVSTYRDRRVLVTGAGGSIGSELARQLKKYNPAHLVLLDKDENNLHEITLEIQEEFSKVSPVVANIRDVAHLESIYKYWKPEVVFHAAAYKHVPLMEIHPREAILNNIVGTKNVCDLSEKYRVNTFVLISTDKAINPSSIMGASKRIAEMIVQRHAMNGTHTRYCCVRFGNVLGSRASVVPLFQKQIRQGKSITVTHPDVKRYFMTIPEAVQLVIQAGSLSRHGEIFLLDMGEPIRIVDLAENLIRLSGLVPDRDIKIEFTGLRPGEKLYEELLSTGEEGIRNTKYPKIFVVKAPILNQVSLSQVLRNLEKAAHSDDLPSIQRILKGIGIGYQMEGQEGEQGGPGPSSKPQEPGNGRLSLKG